MLNSKIFFSGTDESQLHDRALVSNYFMMLIVGYKPGEAYKAKVAFKGNIKGTGKTELSFANNSDGYKNIELSTSTDKEVLVVMNCIVQWQESMVDDYFEERFKKVKDAIEKEKVKVNHHFPNNRGKYEGGPQWEQGELYSKDDFEYRDGLWQKKIGRIGYSPNGKEDWVDKREKKSKKERKKEKKISEMTEAEWRASQEKEYNSTHSSSAIWEIRHVRVFLNSCITQSYEWNYNDPMHAIAKEDKDMTRKEERDEWMMEFRWAMEHYFQYLHANKSEEDYISLLEKCVEYLTPFKYTALVNEMLVEIDDEIDEKTENIMLGGNVL